MQVSVGERLASTVCDTEVIVVRTSSGDLDLRCGGALMTAAASPAAHNGQLAESETGGTVLGKRYVDNSAQIELLCTKAGRGALSIGDAVLTIRTPKTLPSSD